MLVAKILTTTYHTTALLFDCCKYTCMYTTYGIKFDNIFYYADAINKNSQWVLRYHCDTSNLETTNLTNPIMRLSHIPKYTTLEQKRTNICTFLFQNGVWWDLVQVYFEICGRVLFFLRYLHKKAYIFSSNDNLTSYHSRKSLWWNITMVSCQKGPNRHAYAWQIGPFWQDSLDKKIASHTIVSWPTIYLMTVVWYT